jgi:hypothetical protein
MRASCSCMVHIKFTARQQTLIVSPRFSPMALDDALEVTMEQRVSFAEQPEDSLVGQQTVASTEVSLSHEATSDNESQSGDFEEGESGSDIATRLKVAAEATLVGVTYDFGQSTMTKARLMFHGSNDHYFPKGYG